MSDDEGDDVRGRPRPRAGVGARCNGRVVRIVRGQGGHGAGAARVPDDPRDDETPFDEYRRRCLEERAESLARWVMRCIACALIAFSLALLAASAMWVWAVTAMAIEWWTG